MAHRYGARRLKRLLGIAVAVVIATGGLVHGATPAGAVDPFVSIGDASITEGDSGTRIIRLMITLDAPSAAAVVANFSTGFGSAAPGADFRAKASKVRFSPGQTTKWAKVMVRPDGLTEGNEQFPVNLTTVTGATVDDGTGVATIVDDETATGAEASIGDVTVLEGAAGPSRYVWLAVSLNQPAGTNASVAYTTMPGSATAPEDYTTRTGLISFPPKARVRYALVYLAADAVVEGDQSFTVTLFTPTNLTIGDGLGTVTITDDD
jgi:chitinase